MNNKKINVIPVTEREMQKLEDAIVGCRCKVDRLTNQIAILSTFKNIVDISKELGSNEQYNKDLLVINQLLKNINHIKKSNQRYKEENRTLKRRIEEQNVEM